MYTNTSMRTKKYYILNNIQLVWWGINLPGCPLTFDPRFKCFCGFVHMTLCIYQVCMEWDIGYPRDNLDGRGVIASYLITDDLKTSLGVPVLLQSRLVEEIASDL